MSVHYAVSHGAIMKTMLFCRFDDFVERVKVVFENNATDQPGAENRSGETDTN